MQNLPLTLLSLITEHLPLHHKITHLTHIARTFPVLTPACFRHDALEVTQPLLNHIKSTNTVPPHIDAVDTLLFECKTKSQLEQFFDLLTASTSPSFSVFSSSTSSSSSPVTFGQSVHCLFIRTIPNPDDGDDTLTSELIQRLPSLVPLLSSLCLTTAEESPSADFRPLTSLPHLSSLSLVNFCLDKDCLDLLCELPVVQLDLHRCPAVVGAVGGTVQHWLEMCPNAVALDLRVAESDDEEMQSMLAVMVDEADHPVLRRLQHFSFPFFGRSPDSPARADWSHDVMSACLRVLTAYSAQLLTLDLRCEVKEEKEADELMSAVMQCGQLRSLTVGGWWSISSVVLVGPPRLPHLLTLSLDSSEGATSPTETKIASLLDHCPHLQSLDIHSLHSTPPNVLVWINQRCPALRVLRFDQLTELTSTVEDPARWSSVTAAAVAFPSLVSLAMTGQEDGHILCSDVGDIAALLRLAPCLRFLHLDLPHIPPEQQSAFFALTALRGLRLGRANSSTMKVGQQLERCWRKAGGDPKGVAALYSRQQHSTTRLWCSPQLRSDWLSPANGSDEPLLLRSAPPSDQELLDGCWSWGEDACDVFVVSVDGMTGREAFFAALDPVPSDGRKRKRGE